MNFLKANSVVLLTSSACSLLGGNAVLAGGVDQKKNLTDQPDISFSQKGNTDFFEKVEKWIVKHPVKAVILAVWCGYLAVHVLLKVVSWLLGLKKVVVISQNIILEGNTVCNSQSGYTELQKNIVNEEQLIRPLGDKEVMTDSDVEKFNKVRKAISAKELNIVDLAKIDKYKDGVLKAVYACLFLDKNKKAVDEEHFFNRVFLRMSETKMRKSFVSYLKKLRESGLVEFEDYNPELYESEQKPGELLHLCWNMKTVKPEAKKYLAKFVLRHIDLLSNKAKQSVYNVYWGGFCGELLSDEFIKKGEYSPKTGFSKKEESTRLRGIDVEKYSPRVKVKSENILQHKDKNVLKKAIAKCFFKENFVDVSFLSGCTEGLCESFIEFLKGLQKGGKIHLNAPLKDKVEKEKILVYLLKIFKEIKGSLTDEVKELISEFLLSKYSMLSEKVRKIIDIKYKNILKENERFLEILKADVN